MDFARASNDFNALDSCIKPTIALTNTTPNITLQSAHCFKNNVINIMDLAIPHMGWNACYLSVIDDKCYFVEYNPSHSQGYIHDYIKVFYVDDDGKEIVYDRIEYNKEMDIVDNVDMELSLAEDSEMNLFDERKEYYLSSAVCLISTNGGELKFYGMQTYN